MAFETVANPQARRQYEKFLSNIVSGEDRDRNYNRALGALEILYPQWSDWERQDALDHDIEMEME
jgi:hypothetical protein